MSLTGELLIKLDLVESTNNYAMQLIDGNTAQHGLTVVAREQTKGKGQRGKAWLAARGQSLLMSIIVVPKHHLNDQFLFNASIVVAIANVLQNLDNELRVKIKWPNDIIVNDKKAGGVLIENVLRGSAWTHSVIGFGLNVQQASFPDDLPHATSLKIAAGREFEPDELAELLHTAIMETVDGQRDSDQQIAEYNNYLFKAGGQQAFSDANGAWTARIVRACTNGTLEVQLPNGDMATYQHGEVLWVYGG